MRKLLLSLSIALTGCSYDPPRQRAEAARNQNNIILRTKADSAQLNAKTKLKELAQLGFSVSGESVPLGFDVERIANTTSRLPVGLENTLQPLLIEVWPSDFFLGAVEFFGPDRINAEHDDLYPGLSVISHGFFCFGSDGAGNIYAFCVDDGRVYLLPSENFTDEGMLSSEWKEIETNPASIKGVAVQSWQSIDDFLEWAHVELTALKHERDNQSNE